MKLSTAKLETVFQSTPPVKAATCGMCLYTAITAISIHAAREGGDLNSSTIALNVAISIHAAREGGDQVVQL